MYDPETIAAYIAQAARARNIDPSTALAVARSEGLNADPNEAWQSTVVKNGKRERSYGPFQLYIDGGMGNDFMRDTGLDPRDKDTWDEQVDYALDYASQHGWGPWYGAKNIGLSKMAGIGGRPAGLRTGPTRARAEAGLPLNTRRPAGAGLNEPKRRPPPEFVQKGNAWLEKTFGLKPPTDGSDEGSDDLIALGMQLMNQGYF